MRPWQKLVTALVLAGSATLTHGQKPSFFLLPGTPPPLNDCYKSAAPEPLQSPSESPDISIAGISEHSLELLRDISSPEFLAKQKAEGIKYIALENNFYQQNSVDRLYRGEIDRAEFIRSVRTTGNQANNIWFMYEGNPDENLRTITDLILNGRDNGIQVISVDKLEGVSRFARQFTHNLEKAYENQKSAGQTVPFREFSHEYVKAHPHQARKAFDYVGAHRDLPEANMEIFDTAMAMIRTREDALGHHGPLPKIMFLYGNKHEYGLINAARERGYSSAVMNIYPNESRFEDTAIGMLVYRFDDNMRLTNEVICSAPSYTLEDRQYHPGKVSAIIYPLPDKQHLMAFGR